MTNLELCDAITEECKKILSGYKLLNAKNQMVEINVYSQNLPAKKEKNDVSHYPYILVHFDEMNIEEEASEAKIYFLIGTMDNDPKNQGHRDVLEVANKLYIGLFEKTVIKRRYQMKRECKIALQEEDTFPFYLGGMFTTWYLPETVKQIPDNFV